MDSDLVGFGILALAGLPEKSSDVQYRHQRLRDLQRLVSRPYWRT